MDNYKIINGINCAYVFEVVASRNVTQNIAQPSVFSVSTRTLQDTLPIQVGEWKIVPNGEDNNLPFNLRNDLEQNNLAEGIFKRQRGLLYGKGPRLFKTIIEDNVEKDIISIDIAITKWLESFDYIELIKRSIVDFYHTEGVFIKFIPNRGKNKINSLEHVPYERCRFEYSEDLIPKNIIYGDWNLQKYNKFKSFKVFNISKAFEQIAIQYNNMYSFCRPFYGLPAFYGTMEWIKRGSSIPNILKSLSDNSLNIKFHIKSPARYWELKRDQLKENCQLKGELYSEKLLDDLKDKIFTQLAEVMSGVDNVGKFFTSEKALNEFGNMEDWEIIPIEQKVKDFIEAQILISKQADSEITSGMGLHPSLSNIILDGKLSSGSEQLYAYKLYLATEVTLPEQVILASINTAIKLNFPETDLHLGFYRPIVKTEDSITSSDRLKNNV